MAIGRPLIRLGETTSTMDVARALANQGATPGTTVLAGHQTQGRGRAGRTWIAPPWSAITLSFITASRRPMESLGLLSLAWGLAVAETVDAFTGGRSQVKWPNDVLVDGRKIAGILVTNGAVPGTTEYRQVTGIGLNRANLPGDLPPAGTSLAIETGGAPAEGDVLSELLVRLNLVWSQFESGTHDVIVDRIQRRLAYRGEQVHVRDGDRGHAGVVRGIDPRGALLMEDAAGVTRAIVAGELTRGPRRER